MNIVSDLPDFTISAASIFLEEEILSDLEDLLSFCFIGVSDLIVDVLFDDFVILNFDIQAYSSKIIY